MIWWSREYRLQSRNMSLSCAPGHGVGQRLLVSDMSPDYGECVSYSLRSQFLLLLYCDALGLQEQLPFLWSLPHDRSTYAECTPHEGNVLAWTGSLGFWTGSLGFWSYVIVLYLIRIRVAWSWQLLKKAVSSKIMYDASPAAQLRLQLEKVIHTQPATDLRRLSDSWTGIADHDCCTFNLLGCGIESTCLHSIQSSTSDDINCSLRTLQVLTDALIAKLRERTHNACSSIHSGIIWVEWRYDR